MIKFRLLIVIFFLSLSAYCQFPNPGIEGFENTSGPDLPLGNQTSPWTLGTGVPGNQWAVFDNGIGAGRWTINNTTVVFPTPPLVYQGTNSAYINRVNANGVLTTENYLATPLVTIPANGQLRFWTRTFTNGNNGTFYDIKYTAANPGAAAQTNPAAYTNTLVTYTEDQLTLDPDGVQNAYNIYTQKIINFPAAMYGTQVYISFIRRNLQDDAINIDGDRWLLDAVQLNERCLDPTTLATGTILSTSANLTWANPSGAASWEIEVLPAATTATGVGFLYTGALPYTATTTSYGPLPLTQTPLTPNTCYKYYVRAVCPGSIASAWVGPFNFCTTTAPPVCGGNYVDPGGATANYGNNITAANGTTVICPTVPGQLVTVAFTSFATQLNLDQLRIYDGSVVTPTALLGTYSGNVLPPTFTSSSPDGCLTFVFTSNATVTGVGWVANVTCAPPPPCPRPTAVTALTVTPTTINLGWTNVAPATSWQYIVLQCNAPVPTAATPGWVPTLTNPVLINTGLAGGTCYNIYVMSNCTSTQNGMSAPSNPLIITTPVAPPQCGGNFVDSGGISGNYGNNENTTVTICGNNLGDIVTVTFTAFAVENGFDFLKVYDGLNATAPLLANLTGNVIPGPFTASSASGCLTFVFTSDGSVPAAGWLANITCVTPPPCPKPTALISSGVTSNSATLTWTNVGPATSWQVIALACTAPPPNASTTNWIPVLGPATSYTFLNLSPATCYSLYVRADCSSSQNGVSLWAGPLPITTQVAPPVCGGNFVDLGGPTGNYPNNSTAANGTVTICPTIPGEQVTVTFTSFNTEANWDGLYVYDGNAATPGALMPSNNPAGNGNLTTPGAYWGNLGVANLPGPFTGSTPNGCLTFVFISDGVINNPGWLANITCLPPPTCAKPIAVNVVSSTQTSATIGWVQPPNPGGGTATQWQVIILPATAAAPNATTPGWQTANTNPFLYTPLPAGSQFRAYVRAVCSPTDSSLWSNPVTFTLPPISTSTTLYNTTQLVEDVLFNSTCATITNITSSTGSNFGSTNGIGYFNQNGSSFPFSEGIILMTGSVVRAPGPNTEDLGDGNAGWGGDAQLFNYIQGLGIDAGLNSYNNATKLEFDFIPLINNISFDFIFASEEYGTFQCDFSDAFAFFLTNTTTGVTTNLAVLPSTTIPISVVTIRNQIYNPFGTCGSANAQYFANYYGDDGFGLPPEAAPIDFNGHTVPLTATSAVTPGTQYHIKLVIADRNDSVFDSAVFLKGGSFNIGNVELGNSLLEATNNALCDSASYTIQSGLSTSLYTFTWTFNGNLIPNETGPNLTVTQEGIYGINATYINTTCTATDTITIEFYDPVASGTPNTMSICNGTGFAQFTLSQNNPSSLGVLNPTAYTVVYYATIADATAEINALPNLYTNVAQYQQTIYVRVENIQTGCFTIKPFNLVVQDLTPLFTITPNFEICSGTSGTITVTPTNYNNADAIYSWTLNGNSIPGATNQLTVTQGGTYVVTINHFGCLNTGQTIVTVVPFPVPDAPGTVNACNNYTLPALTVGNYYTQTGGPNGTGTLLPANTVLTTPQTVYVYAQNGTVPCSAENSFQVNITPLVTPTFTQVGTLCLNDPVPVLPTTSINGISGLWNPSINTTVAGTTIHTFTPATGSCASTVTMSITVAPFTVPTFTQLPSVCQGGTAGVLLTSSNNPNNPIAGLWTPSAVNTNNPGTTTYTFTPNAGQCASTTTMTITVHPLPVVNPVSNVSACDSYTLPPLLVGNYFSSPNGVGPITSLTLTSDQTVYVYAQSGTTPNCTDQESFQVTITDTPQFTIDGGCEGSAYLLEVANANFSSQNIIYNWSGPGTFTNGGPSIIANAAGTYTCTISVNGSCPNTVTFVVGSNDLNCLFPQGISPNGDGRNDTLDLSGFNVSKLSIFNRYGKTVYSKGNYTNEWGGQSDSGNELADGTYYYVMERKDGGDTKTGWVYINRETK